MCGIYNSGKWFNDIDKIMQNLPEITELAGMSVLITGAAGLICSAVTDIFIRYNETHNIPIRIIAAGRWSQRMSDRFGKFYDRDYFSFVQYDASKDDNKIDVKSDYIIHGASNASPNKIVAEPVETMLSNFKGLNYLLNYVRENGTKRLLYISSSEVYGKKNEKKPFKEGEYGYIDLLNPRNSYSVAKRAAETLCTSYYAEYGVESVIVRPGHIYGPTATQQDNRVSSAFAHSAARGENLIMKSAGTQIRSYCHCLDCASAIIKVLLKGESGKAYNISNPDSICTISDMAKAMAEAGGVELVCKAASEEEKREFNPMDNSSLESVSLQALGWEGVFGVPYGFARTVEILRYMHEEKSACCGQD